MKRCIFKISMLSLFILALAVALFLPFSAEVAHAEASGKSVIKAAVSNLKANEFAGKSSVELYQKDGSRKFCIPESYYLSNMKPIVDGLTYFNAEYCGQTFNIDAALADTSTVTEYFEEDEPLYPDVTLIVKEGAQVPTQGELKNLDNTYVIKLLGYATEADSNEIYVMATKEGTTYFGFVDRAVFEDFNVPYQKKAQTERDALIAQEKNKLPDPSAGDLPAPSGSLALKIILIIGITVPAILIMILLFIPSRNSRSYERNTSPEAAPRAPLDDRRTSDARYNGGDGRNNDPRGSSGYNDPHYNDPRYNDPRYNNDPRGNGYDPRGGSGYNGSGYNGSGYNDPRYNDPRDYDNR